ncbi:hypothetical protein KPG71_14825 [Roseovarius sp. PS-C2]|uniref:hypothetical protein n=1 Tax=Roseovarius sp. PS-C2 TaxID=2820814 RepID=UPI001C0E7B4E|nr:hypothetical protein [Roseovarius sp. PS-C2]MBU3261296.1 hypothetical protein [Roseovarius sp. PS-C2]
MPLASPSTSTTTEENIFSGRYEAGKAFHLNLGVAADTGVLSRENNEILSVRWIDALLTEKYTQRLPLEIQKIDFIVHVAPPPAPLSRRSCPQQAPRGNGSLGVEAEIRYTNHQYQQ